MYLHISYRNALNNWPLSHTIYTRVQLLAMTATRCERVSQSMDTNT